MHQDLKGFPGALYFGVTAEAKTKAVVRQSHLARIPLFTCAKEVGISHCGTCSGQWEGGSMTSECVNCSGSVVDRW